MSIQKIKYQITSSRAVKFNDLGSEVNEQFRKLYYESAS